MAISFLSAMEFPLFTVPKAIIKNRARGITYASSPKIPNITSLMAFPKVPAILKLQTKRKMQTANKPIRKISFRIAVSMGSAFLWSFRAEAVLPEFPLFPVVFLRLFALCPPFPFFVCAIPTNLAYVLNDSK